MEPRLLTPHSALRLSAGSGVSDTPRTLSSSPSDLRTDPATLRVSRTPEEQKVSQKDPQDRVRPPTPEVTPIPTGSFPWSSSSQSRVPGQVPARPDWEPFQKTPDVVPPRFL